MTDFSLSHPYILQSKIVTRERVTEMISYEPFWRTIEEKHISTYALINKHGILPDTIQRLRNGRPLTTTTLNTLCEVLHCGIGDIAEYKHDEE